MTVAAVAVVVPNPVARIEVQVVGVVLEARIERTRPVETVRAVVEETLIPAAACRGQENRITIRTGHANTVDTVLTRPFTGAII